MKLYQIYLLLLKLSMVIQVILIFFKVHTQDSIPYLISDILFKSSIGLFLIMYFYVRGSPTLDVWDELFISFGGVLLVFDAWWNVFPQLLEKYNIKINPYTFGL